MATVPHRFSPGEVASSSEMNENFDYFASMIGDQTSQDGFRPNGPILVGPNAQLAGRNADFLHIGWNADQYLQGATAKVRRIADGKAATFLRVGSDGFSVWTTSSTQGDLQAQAHEVFGVHATTGDDYIFIHPTWRFHQSKAMPWKTDHVRTTYVAFSNPVTLYEGGWHGGGPKNHNVFNHGVPKQAIAVEVLVYATATPNSGAAVKLMQGASQPHQKTGFICHAYGGNAAHYGRSGAQGKVLIGRDAYAGQIVEQRTAAVESLSIYVQGYYI